MTIMKACHCEHRRCVAIRFFMQEVLICAAVATNRAGRGCGGDWLGLREQTFKALAHSLFHPILLGLAKSIGLRSIQIINMVPTHLSVICSANATSPQGEAFYSAYTHDRHIFHFAI